MDLKLKNKIVLITGSSSGIGRDIASKFLQEGCHVIINGRNEQKLRNASKALENCFYVKGDITDDKDIEKIVKICIKKYKKIDILICNVGSGRSKPIGKESINDIEKMLKINFYSSTKIIYKLKQTLIKSKASIICISSIAGIEFTTAPTGYTVAKAALNAYVSSISRYFAKKQVRINVVAPGNILFKGSVWEKKLLKDKKQVNKMLKTEVPMNRFGVVEEISNLVVFLSSKCSSFTTGSVITIDGGQTRTF